MRKLAGEKNKGKFFCRTPEMKTFPLENFPPHGTIAVVTQTDKYRHHTHSTAPTHPTHLHTLQKKKCKIKEAKQELQEDNCKKTAARRRQLQEDSCKKKTAAKRYTVCARRQLVSGTTHMHNVTNSHNNSSIQLWCKHLKKNTVATKPYAILI